VGKDPVVSRRLNFPLKTIKHILAQYAAWIAAVLKPLGIWGVFAIAAVDSALLGMPVDAVVVGYVYNDRKRFVFYVGMAALGSALGSIPLYLIGYLGGEEVLRKRISAARFNKIHRSFERHEFLALMLPGMLPPPFPFKLFVLAAAVFEMRFSYFLTAIFAGRLLRFTFWSLLALAFGPQIVGLLGELFRRHFYWLLAVVVLLGGLLWLLRRQGRRQQA
jgi:membrane protein YqaA with SNARE-associated domain